MSHSSEIETASSPSTLAAQQHQNQNSQSELAERIQRLQSKLTNMKILIAVPMGMLMIIYFFTFAMLIDHGLVGALYFELLSTIAFVFAFIYLNRLGFWLLKKRFAKHRLYGQILKQLDIESIAKDARQIADRLSV